jgi:DNA-binding transcriptional regulator YiaG
VPGWYPEGDGDAIHSGEDLRAYNEAFKEREAYAARIKTVRKKLGLTQEEAGVIGGGKRAFQKYESGRTPPSDAAVGLIEILARHPEEVASAIIPHDGTAMRRIRGTKARHCLLASASSAACATPQLDGFSLSSAPPVPPRSRRRCSPA